MMAKRTAIAQPVQFQTRADDGNLYIEGYFAVYGSKYWLWDDAYETIEPGAFDGETERDVRALVDHDTRLVLGRTTAGTLTLRIDEKGLWGSILINPKDQDAMNLYERVKRGDVNQCSFGFDIVEQSTDYNEDGPSVWHLRKVKLWEVSVATFPAYEDTQVEARKAEINDIKRRKAEKWRADMKTKIKGGNK